MKTTMRCCLITAGITIIIKATTNKCWLGCREKGTLVHCWWECELVQPLWKTVQRFLKKLKIRSCLGTQCLGFWLSLLWPRFHRGQGTEILQAMWHDQKKKKKTTQQTKKQNYRMTQASHQETQEMWVRSLGQEDPLEKKTTTHSRILA